MAGSNTFASPIAEAMDETNVSTLSSEQISANVHARIRIIKTSQMDLKPSPKLLLHSAKVSTLRGMYNIIVKITARVEPHANDIEAIMSPYTALKKNIKPIEKTIIARIGNTKSMILPRGLTA